MPGMSTRTSSPIPPRKSHGAAFCQTFEGTRNTVVAAASAMQAEEKGVPAVYVINPRTRQIVPAAFGSMGFTELAQRIVYAIQSASQPQGDVASGEYP